MRFLKQTFLFLALLFPCVSFAQVTGGWVDPNILQAVPVGAILNGNVNGLARRSQTVNVGIRNLVLIVAGQSNLTDITPSPYSPTNAASIDLMNILDGGVYAAVDPLVGCSYTFGGGNPALRLADNLITAALFDRVILMPIAVGGSSVADWATGTSSNRIQVALQRLTAKGFVAQANVTLAIIWGQGETDNVLGTTQQAYTSSFNTVVSNAVSAGFSGRWFVAKETWNGTAVSSAIQAAQASVVSGSVFAGVDADALINSTCSASPCRQNPDPAGDVNLHFTDAGAASYASGWQTKMHASGSPF